MSDKTTLRHRLKTRLHTASTYLVNWMQSFNANDPEVEFYPAALEILEKPPSPVGRATASIIILFFLLALGWSIIGSVDIIATAQGKIIPTLRTKTIQPLEAGVLRAIHVQDGQTVKAGDVLIEIDSTINEAERDRLHNEYVTASLDVARLKALLSVNKDPLTVLTPTMMPLLHRSKPSVRCLKINIMRSTPN